jgi:hypothetical protein
MKVWRQMEERKEGRNTEWKKQKKTEQKNYLLRHTIAPFLQS